jgi:hypothetical protein|tara:strand:- start:7353 stop:7502 length:150 start_codon:yes stop_codon:yes gene_type:complete
MGRSRGIDKAIQIESGFAQVFYTILFSPTSKILEDLSLIEGQLPIIYDV